MIDELVSIEDKEAINNQVEFLAKFLGTVPDSLKEDMPTEHYFAPGVYARELTLKKDVFIVGKKHKTSHLNIVLTGKGRVLVDGELKHIKAGDIFVSKPNVRKVGLADEDMKFLNIFPTSETDTEKLEQMLTYEEIEPEVEELQMFLSLINRGVSCQQRG